MIAHHGVNPIETYTMGKHRYEVEHSAYALAVQGIRHVACPMLHAE